MGRDKARRSKGAAAWRGGDGETLEFEGSPSIWIESALDPSGGSALCCRVKWGQNQAVLPVAKIRAAARDLFACAVYAETMVLLRSLGMEDGHVQAMVADMIKRSGRSFLGVDGFIELNPGITRERGNAHGAPTVLISMGAYGEARLKGGLTVEGAREMAVNWLSACETSTMDTVLDQVLTTVVQADPQQRAALFAYLKALRELAEDGRWQERDQAREAERAKALYQPFSRGATQGGE